MPTRLATIIAAALAAVFLAALGASAQGDTIVSPDPSIPPEVVVAIQLEALRTNDPKEGDRGIRQAWAFAHPDNRAMTGPLPSFSWMLKGPFYSPLLNHRRHSFAEIGRSRAQVEYRVLLEDREGRMLGLFWVVGKVAGAPFEDCWMTTAVTPPLPAGQGT